MDMKILIGVVTISNQNRCRIKALNKIMDADKMSGSRGIIFESLAKSGFFVWKQKVNHTLTQL